MKLLDLQTGKYLELGEDWHYCGNRIYLVRYLKECITSFNEFLRGQMKTLAEYKEIDGQRNIGYELACKVATSDDECVNNAVDSQVDSGYVEKSEPQEILKTLCDKTGAVVYGDRYVLVIKDYNIQIGDLWKNSKYSNTLVACINFKNNIHFKHNISGGLESCFEEIRNDNNDNLIVRCSQNENSELLGNIFAEYSKQLRNEENKFAELTEKLK